jgi:hypothetical protein
MLGGVVRRVMREGDLHRHDLDSGDVAREFQRRRQRELGARVVQHRHADVAKDQSEAVGVRFDSRRDAVAQHAAVMREPFES